jgi:thiamine-phosphate pyrophosphorylase
MQSGYEGYELTAAAERVVDEAAGWVSASGANGQAAGAVLLGLLAESECRAAQWLRARGCDQAAVLARYPDIMRQPGNDAGATPPLGWLRPLLHAADAQFVTLPRPHTIASEHLLLGLLAADTAVANWLDPAGSALGGIAAEIASRQGLALASSHQPAGLAEEVAEALEEVSLDEIPGDAEETVEQLEEEQVDETVVEDDSAEDAQVEATATGALLGKPAVAPHADSHQLARETPTRETLTSRIVPLGVWRVLDAAANRAGEGLRVVEDYARFVLGDRHLVAQLKAIRHELAAAVGHFPKAWLLAARDTPGDVGTTISTPSEQVRGDLAAVVTANFKRAAEALRSLEEFAKLVDPAVALEFERLRYRGYTLAKALGTTELNRARLGEARLYVLIDGGSRPGLNEAEAIARFESLAIALVSSGVDVLQLRDKQLGDAALLDRARRLRAITRGTRTLFVVNDRPDLAAASRADGVHVGQDELSVADARAIVGPGVLVGVSTHSIEQAEAAVLNGADYLGVGPTFPSATKQFVDFPGLAFLREVAGRISLPAFAIGGVKLDHLDEVLATGVTRVAVRDAIVSADDPAAAARAFRERLFNQNI